MGRGRSRAVLVGRAYPGSAPGLAATLKFSSAESRGRGCGQAGTSGGVVTSVSAPCVTTRGPAPRGASLAAGRELESARARIWAR